MSQALILRAITGPQAGQRYTLTARTTMIGSAASSDLVLHDRLLNPRHVEIRQVLGRWFVAPTTAHSQGLALNGLAINGQSRINEGDRLTIGSTTYRVGFEELIEQEVGGASASTTTGVPRIGEYFIRRGMLSIDQVKRVSERQSVLQHDGRRLQFGQLAYEMGFITRSQLDTALAEQRSDFNDRFWD